MYWPTASDFTSGSGIGTSLAAERTRPNARSKSSRRSGTVRRSTTPSLSARSARPMEGRRAATIKRGLPAAPRSASTHHARSPSACSPSTANTMSQRAAASWRTASGSSGTLSNSTSACAAHCLMFWNTPAAPSVATARTRNTGGPSWCGAWGRPKDSVATDRLMPSFPRPPHTGRPAPMHHPYPCHSGPRYDPQAAAATRRGGAPRRNAP